MKFPNQPAHGVASFLAGVFLATTTSMAADVTIHIWHTETEPQTIAAFDDIARRFEAENPGIRVDALGLGWAELEGKITAALAAGAPPELSHGQPITCGTMQSRGLLLPLDDVVEAIGEDNVLPHVRRVCNVDGTQYGLVHALSTSLLLYRKDIAEELGLTPPRSWDDVIARAKAMTRDTDGDGLIDIYGVTLPGDNLFINIILGELIRANNGSLFDANNRPLMTDPKMIEVLNYLRKLLKYAPPGWESAGYLQTFENFSSQKAAMMIFGHGRGAGMIERSVPMELASDKTFGVWKKPPGPSSQEAIVQVDEEPWMLFKDARHPEEAKKFLEFLYRDDNYLQYVSTVPIHLLPITKSLRQSQGYKKIDMFDRWHSWIDAQQESLDKDLARPALVAEWSDLTEKPYLLDVLNSGILRDMVIAVVIEREEPESAAQKAQTRLVKLLKRKGVLASAAKSRTQASLAQ